MVRIGVPQPSPQVFPSSSVLPAGADAAGNADYPPTQDEAAATSPKRGEFVIAPIPFSNQVFSFGLAPVVEYLFHLGSNDQKSPPSSLVLGGMITEHDSWAIGGGGRFILSHDRYRVSVFGGHGTVAYDLFGVGNQGGDAGHEIPIRQGGDLAFAQVLFRVRGKFFLGPRFNYRRLTARLNSDTQSVPLPAGLNPADLGALFSSHAFGLEALHDTRSDMFYPTRGHEFQFVGDFFNGTETLLNLPERDVGYQQYQASYNQYLPLSLRQVLAFRGMVCAVDGDPPFYELCQFGSMSDIRGYQPGRYRDRRMFAGQSEYRRILSPRWGFVVFAGAGEVAHAWNLITGDNLLPAGGTGVRFNLSKKERINLRADIAYGTTGWSWNFSLGEAF